MGRQIEIPVVIKSTGSRDLNSTKDAIKGLKAEVGSVDEKLQHYDRSAAAAARQTDNAARAARAARDEFGKFTRGADDAGLSMSRMSGLSTGLVSQLVATAATIKTLTIDTATYAARTETLAVVTDRLARINNLGRDAVRAQVESVRKQGITYQESYSTINKMIQAQLDLKKATDLARLAQDAAVIGGTNSSDALAGIIHGITTRQTDVLRTYGIIVDFEAEYAKAAAKVGHKLSEVEKQQVAVNAVLEQGGKIAGSYEAAMGTAGKQLSSLSRHFDDLKQAVGVGFVPALSKAVMLAESLAKWGQESSFAFQQAAAGASALTVGLAVGRIAGPWAGAAAATLTYAAGQHTVDDDREMGASRLSGIVARKQAEVERFKKVTKPSVIELEGHKRILDQYDTALSEAKDDITGQIAKTIKERDQGGVGNLGTTKVGPLTLPYWRPVNKTTGIEKIPAAGMDLGNGVRVTREQVLAKMNPVAGDGPVKGALFNQAGYDKALKDARDAENAAKGLKTGSHDADTLSRFMAELRELKVPLDSLTQRPEAGALLESQRKNALASAPASSRPAINEIFDIKKAAALTDQDKARAEVLKQQQRTLEEQTQELFKQAQALDEQRLMRAAMDASLGDRTVKFGSMMIGSALGAYETDRTIEGINKGAARDDIARQLNTAQRVSSINASAGMAGERKSIDESYTISLQLAKEMNRIDLDAAKQLSTYDDQRIAEARAMADLKKATADAEINHELSLLEMAKKRTQELRQGAGSVYDALRQGGRGGLKSLAMGQLDTMGRTAFQNVAEKVQSATGAKMPGFDPGGKLGWLFKGTPFEGSSGDPLIDSQGQLKVAIDANTAALKSGGMPGTGGAGSVAGMPGAILDNWGSVSDIFGFGGGGVRNVDDSVTAGVASGAIADVLGSGGGAKSAGKSGSSKTANIGKGVALAGAGVGVYMGIKQGGAQGYSNAVASGLMGAAAFGGPAAPYLMAGAMAAGLIGSFLGPDKAKRQAEIDSSISGAAFTGNTSIVRDIDFAGNSVDFDKRGNTRSTSSANSFTLNINALDSKSIIDAGPEIADSIRLQILRDHPINDELRQRMAA